MPTQLTAAVANAILAADDLNDNWDLIEDSFGAVGPYVISGLVPSIGTGLSVDVTAGSALIGMLVTVASSFTIGSLAASNTNHLYLLDDGTGTSNTSGTAPAGSVKLGTATTGVATVTSVDTAPGSGRQIKPVASTVVNRAISTKTTTYTLTANDSVILADATGGAFSLNLPTAAGISGTVYTVKKIDSSANAVTIDPSGAETVDGAATLALSTQHQVYDLISDGTNWRQLPFYNPQVFLKNADQTLAEGVDIAVGTTTGTKIGTATTQKLGFFNATPVVRPAAYTPTNVSSDRSYDANATTLDEVADVLGTLIADMQALGLIG